MLKTTTRDVFFACF